MIAAIPTRHKTPAVPLTAAILAQLLSESGNCSYSLFLDIDGTLSDFHVDPQQSYIPATAISLLEQLIVANVPVCLVTGRAIVDARRLVSSLDIPIAGSHGLEISLNQASSIAPSIDKHELALIKQQVYAQCQADCEWLIEEKPYSIALHYRQYPHKAAKAQHIMQTIVQDFPKWQLKPGKCVFEIAPKAANKGEAIKQLITYLSLENYRPIFIGDDITDEAGFSFVQHFQTTNYKLAGIGIKVGDGDTQADFRVADTTEVVKIITRIVDFLTITTPLS